MADLPVTKLPLRVKDITGQQFGKLTAVRYIGRRTAPCGKSRSIWEFQCECGKFKEISFSVVNKGKTASCGCDLIFYRRRGERQTPLTQREKYLKHRPKRLAARKIYVLENAHKIKAYVRAHLDYYRVKASARRAKIRSLSGRTHLVLAWFKRVKRKKVRCYYCAEVIPKGKLNIDHVIPVIENGPHSLENLAASCSRCNHTKNRKRIEDWDRIGQQMLPL